MNSFLRGAAEGSGAESLHEPSNTPETQDQAQNGLTACPPASSARSSTISHPRNSVPPRRAARTRARFLPAGGASKAPFFRGQQLGLDQGFGDALRKLTENLGWPWRVLWNSHAGARADRSLPRFYRLAFFEIRR